MTLQQKLVQVDDYLDMLKDKAKETDELAKENLQLRTKISKAIEYIEHAQNYAKEKYLYVNGDDLLDILKGVDKE